MFIRGFLIGLIVGLMLVSFLLYLNIKVPVVSSFGVHNEMSWYGQNEAKMTSNNKKTGEDFGYHWE